MVYIFFAETSACGIKVLINLTFLNKRPQDAKIVVICVWIL